LNQNFKEVFIDSKIGNLTFLSINTNALHYFFFLNNSRRTAVFIAIEEKRYRDTNSSVYWRKTGQKP
jgi:hypothetical protein